MLFGKLYLHLSAETVRNVVDPLMVDPENLPINWQDIWRDITFAIDGQPCMVMVAPLYPGAEADGSFNHDAMTKALWELAQAGTEITITCYTVNNDIGQPVDSYPGGSLTVMEFYPYRLRLVDGYWVDPSGQRLTAISTAP